MLGLSLLHVEVALKHNSQARYDSTRSHVEELIRSHMVVPHSSLSFHQNPFLAENVKVIRICELEGNSNDCFGEGWKGYWQYCGL
jgi:hypothetical protein